MNNVNMWELGMSPIRSELKINMIKVSILESS
jgi:hypothetical protein